MNEILKKNNTLKLMLDDQWYLTTDGFKGLILQRDIEKTRKKIDKETRKETGETEIYIDTESFYHPNLSQVLDKYLRVKTKEAKSIEQLKEIVLRVEEKISNLQK